MIKNENLLITLGEEASEISFAVSKAIRFGLYSRISEEDYTKAQEIVEEYYHLQTMIEMCQEEGILPVYGPMLIDDIKKDKRRKVKAAQKISIDKGLVTK